MSVSAEVYFTDTETTLKKLVQELLKNKVFGKCIRESSVFLGRDVNTLINLPCVERKIINPAPTFLDIGDAGETYFFIKQKTLKGYWIAKVHVSYHMQGNGFRILVNIEIIQPESADNPLHSLMAIEDVEIVVIQRYCKKILRILISTISD